MFDNYVSYLESLAIINDKILYTILKAFNELINISNCCIVSANKIYRNATI